MLDRNTWSVNFLSWQGKISLLKPYKPEINKSLCNELSSFKRLIPKQKDLIIGNMNAKILPIQLAKQKWWIEFSLNTKLKEKYEKKRKIKLWTYIDLNNSNVKLD